MANINDYLQWRGDLTFAERPFNDVDNIILAALSYLDFTGIVPGEATGRQVTVGQACVRLLEKSGGDVTPYVRSVAKVDSRFVQLLADSRRFRDALLGAYVDEVDESRALQFAALQVDMPGETYVSFRGTDSTLVGWREDFMLSFTVTESQREAASYLQRAIVRAVGQGRTVRVGGHSKGGNLAVYAVLKADDLVRLRVEKCFSHDGPGLNEACMSDAAWPTTAALVDKTIPEESIIGLIFEGREITPVIVRSTNPGLLQHAPFSWEIEGTDFDIQRAVSYDSYKTGKRLNAWLKTMDEAGRERFVTILYKLAESTGEVTFSGLTDSVKNGSLSLMLQKLDNMSAEDKKFFTDALSDLVATILLGPAPKKAVTPTEKVAEAGDKIDDATARFNDRLAQIERLAGL